jgi:hypothetical protein
LNEKFTIGEVGCSFNQFSIAARSKVFPSGSITGSFIISRVIGHKKLAGTSAILSFNVRNQKKVL